MPFNKNQHCTPVIQTTVGLYEPNCQVPQYGNRMRAGAHGINLVSCSSHAQPLTPEDATRVWDLIPQPEKDNPRSIRHAHSLSLLAQMAGQGTPQGCSDMLPAGEASVENVTHYHTLGPPLFKERRHAHYFISFVCLNTDINHRMKWQDMTGCKQYEWNGTYDAFIVCGETFVRVEPNTRGLCGTDPSRIHNPAELMEAMQRSPSLSGRRTADHVIPALQWNATGDTVRRNLFG